MTASPSPTERPRQWTRNPDSGTYFHQSNRASIIKGRQGWVLYVDSEQCGGALPTLREAQARGDEMLAV